MKLKFIVLGGILSLSSTGFVISSQEVVKMPDAETLQTRLNNSGLKDFAKKTDFVKKLANKEKIPLAISSKIELSILDYNEIVKKEMPEAIANLLMIQVQMAKPRLFKALLKDEQEALEKLKKLGLYKPKK